MNPYQDPFKPLPGETFSKRQVDRAGPLLRAFFSWDPATDEPFDHPDVTDLRHHVAKEDAFLDERIDVTQRLKRTSTIGDKLSREPTMQVTQMQDIGGVRARLPSVRHVYAVSRRLKKSWTIHRTRDYIAAPKPSGYRALHHLVRRDGVLIEVQLRTTLQDTWANQVEDDSEMTGVTFKFGRGPTEVHEHYVAMSQAFALIDTGKPVPAELAEALNQSYAKLRAVLPRPSGRSDT